MNGILNISPQNDYFGDILVNVIVSDGLFETSKDFKLTVLPVNDAPIVSTISDQSVFEDTELAIEIVANDLSLIHI